MQQFVSFALILIKKKSFFQDFPHRRPMYRHTKQKRATSRERKHNSPHLDDVCVFVLTSGITQMKDKQY